MKRLLTMFLSTTLFILLVGCNISQDISEKKELLINLPTDNTVNGYRISTKPSPKNDVFAESGYYSSSAPITESSQITYCVNVKTHKFHRSDCSSVNTIKENNKLYSKDREKLVLDGFSPCKKCNP